MLTLAFDSTAKIASVAVLDGERVLAEYNVNNGLTQSELLLPMAENILSALHLSLDDIGLLATSVGPGSFTGVRIGAALVKGLAFGKNIPCVSVSTLDALAENIRGIKGTVLACMDARRNQVYNAVYRADGTELTKLCPDRAIAISDLADEVREYDGPIYLVGDGYESAREGLIASGILPEHTPENIVLESAASVGRVAYRKYLAGEVQTDLEIAPTYLRMPQAERERLEKLENKKG